MAGTRQPSAHLHDPTGEAELAPSLYESRSVGLRALLHLHETFFVLRAHERRRLVPRADVQGTSTGSDVFTFVKVQGHVRVVVLVDGRPAGVVAVVKGPSCYFELVAVDELVVAGFRPSQALRFEMLCGSVGVDPASATAAQAEEEGAP